MAEQGEEVAQLYQTFLIVAAAIFVLTAGLIVWSIIRYRTRRDESLPPQFDRNLALEITWFAIPTGIVVVLFLLSLGVLQRVDAEVAEPTVTVRVQAFQWGWQFTYEDSGVVLFSLPQAPAEVVLPVGEPVSFILSSADVIHSFYVPRLLTKRDALPGRTNRIDVTLTEEGRFEGHCAEFCGLLHDRMHFAIRVVPDEEFDEWLSDQEVARGNP